VPGRAKEVPVEQTHRKTALILLTPPCLPSISEYSEQKKERTSGHALPKLFFFHGLFLFKKTLENDWTGHKNRSPSPLRDKYATMANLLLSTGGESTIKSISSLFLC
jgi:hypothetical protein